MPIEQRSRQKIYIIQHPDDQKIIAYSNARRALIRLQGLSGEMTFSWEDDKLDDVIITDDLDAAASRLRSIGQWVNSGPFRCTCILLY